VTPLALRVLRIFPEMNEDRLDLHVLFEAGGNEPEERLQVLDAIDELVSAGLLDACGNDFYELTEKGKQQAQRREYPARNAE
jgi:hypothetical protein